MTLSEMLEAAHGAADAGGEADLSSLDALLVGTEAALEGLPHVAVSEDAAQKLRLGNSIILRGRDAPAEADDAYATLRGKLVAIGAVEAGMFKPRRVFPA